MKLKKYSYILVLILVLLIGMKSVYAQNAEDTCKSLFGTINPTDNQDSLREIMRDILMIPKIAIPVIIIGLGMLDFSKAVLASKEDEMRKAQSTFIKRVLIGVTVFFVPTIINVLMDIMEAVLGYSTNCL